MNILDEEDIIYEKAYAFLPFKAKLNITQIKIGSINKTYLISPLDNYVSNPFILQRINKSIFDSTENLILNYILLERAISSAKLVAGSRTFTSFKIPKLLKTQTNNYVVPSGEGDWRGFEYIRDTITYHIVDNQKIAFRALSYLAEFHYLTKNIKENQLSNTIYNFHNTPNYLDQYMRELFIYIDTRGSSDFNKVKHLINFIENNKTEAYLLRSQSKIIYC